MVEVQAVEIAEIGNGGEVSLLLTGFLILIMFVMAYRLNRDEGIIVMLHEGVTTLESERLKTAVASGIAVGVASCFAAMLPTIRSTEAAIAVIDQKNI